MRRRSKRSAVVLSALAVAALAAVTAGLSGATFATETGDVRVTATAGSLDLSSTNDGQSVIATATDMRPGQSRSGLVTVEHLGSVPATALFDVLPGVTDAPGGGPRLSEVLELDLELCSSAAPGCPGAVSVIPPAAQGRTLAEAALSPWLHLGAGESQPSDARTYRLTLSWPATEDDPDLQGTSTQATLAFGLWAGS